MNWQSKQALAIFAGAMLLLSGCMATPTEQKTPTPNSNAPDSTEVTVSRVIDGDTIEITYQNNTTDTVRLIGVDTPEVHTSVSPSEFEDIPNTTTSHCWLQSWGKNASQFTNSTLYGEQVTLTYDVQTGRHGYYGRLLAYVHYKGKLFNSQLVKQGYARVYEEGKSSEEGRFLALEAHAKEHQNGLWDYSKENVESCDT